VAHANAMGYGNKARGLDNPQPSPVELALFSREETTLLDAVQRLDVSGPVMNLVDPESIRGRGEEQA
jgi:hypothetical protein